MTYEHLTPHIPLAIPPWTQGGRRLESLCRKALYTFDLLEPSGTLAIALSGGKDSLTLLYLLKAILGRGCPHLDLVALHVAGPFSCGASIGKGFLQRICDQLQVPLITCTSQSQEQEPLSCYPCSRQRRSLLFEAAKQAGAKTIAFGHHRDDNAETVLMNLLHKGEFAGMLPKIHMEDYGITIIRPLIFATASEIFQFAKHYGFARIVCQCPVGQHSMRKKSRTLLTAMENTFPNATQNLATASLVYGSKKAQKK